MCIVRNSAKEKAFLEKIHRAKWQAGRKPKREAEDVDASFRIDVGGRIRILRTSHELSLRALAERSNLNFNTLSLIERGKTSPSVNTLQQIAAALQIPITAFFESAGPPKTLVYQRSGSRPSTSLTNGKLQDLCGGLTLQGGKIMLLQLEPLSGEHPGTIIHTGQEFAFCLEGSLEYVVDGQVYPLTSGDSLIFEAHLPHGWRNPGPAAARFLLVLSPSDQNDRPVQKHFPQEAV
jgi:transcriptional regulator with XRE-family HTH domain